MMSNLCTPMGGPLPKKFGKRNFFHPLGVGGMVQNFPSNRPWKGVSNPKLVLRVWELPPNKFMGRVKVSPNFVIFQLFRPFLPNGVRYHQSENGISNYGHFLTRWWQIVYFGPSWNTWLRLIRTHPAISFSVFSQSDSMDTWVEVFQLDEAASS